MGGGGGFARVKFNFGRAEEADKEAVMVNGKLFVLWAVLVSGFAFSTGCVAQTTAPAGLTVKSSVNEILDALDARGKNLKNFSATAVLTDTDMSTGDSTINTGKALLQRKGQDDARVRIHFTTQQLGNMIFKVDHDYMLDNGVLDERDYLKKHETINQVLKPGTKLDLFKLGEGPFPLPLGQKRENVLANFQVEKMAADPSDPAGTVHLRLTPKEGSQFVGKFKTIDIWVDVASAMPRRIQTIDINQTTTRTTDLTNVKINGDVGDKDFVQEPMPKDSDVVEGPLAQ
jgi:outer membrane lipoprotein-sorting protein